MPRDLNPRQLVQTGKPAAGFIRCGLCRRGWPTLPIVLAALLSLGVGFGSDSALAKKGKKKAGKGVAEVIGQVIDQTGAPLSGVAVSASKVGGGGDDEALTGESDKDGRFRIRFEQSTGSYLFRLTKEGFREFEGTISVAAGVRQEMEFRLIDESLGRRRDAGTAYNAGVEAFNAGDQAGAQAKFERAIALDPELLPPYLGLADIYYRSEEDDKAARAVDHYLSRKPEDLQALRLAFTLHRRRGDDEKVATLLQAVRGTPLARNFAIADYNEGVARQAEDVGAAVALFKSALDIDPTLSVAQAGLASLYFNREEYAAAQTAVEALLAAEPENPLGRRILFMAKDAQADPSADTAFESYFELEPDAALDLLYRRAEADFRAGELATAMAALERILQARPEMPDANYTLGLCYASADDKSKAKQYLQRFLELAPEHPEAAAAREMLSYF